MSSLDAAQRAVVAPRRGRPRSDHCIHVRTGALRPSGSTRIGAAAWQAAAGEQTACRDFKSSRRGITLVEMRIGPGTSVEIDYELKVKGGEVIESSARSGPLRYVHGDGKMLPGLEKRLTGLAAGDERSGEIPAAEAFGTEDSLPVTEMPRSSFPKDAKLEVGMVFEGKDPASGSPVRFKLLSVDGDRTQVRLLHPLVGRDIEYQVKVLDVRSAKSAPPPPPGAVELDLEEIQDN
jgi:FKBP-type peptidyl-prolyl cis-trans isomerase SlyD